MYRMRQAYMCRAISSSELPSSRWKWRNIHIFSRLFHWKERNCWIFNISHRVPKISSQRTFLPNRESDDRFIRKSNSQACFKTGIGDNRVFRNGHDSGIMLIMLCNIWTEINNRIGIVCIFSNTENKICNIGCPKIFITQFFNPNISYALLFYEYCLCTLLCSRIWNKTSL
jgi:hypothetical protein